MHGKEVSRRNALRAGMGAAAITGLLAAGAGSGIAMPHPEKNTGETFPDVPGMSGDRRANELWYRFNQETLYDQSAEIKEAYAEINGHFGGNLPLTLRETWSTMYLELDYPDNYAAFMSPAQRALRTLSRIQLGVFDAY